MSHASHETHGHVTRAAGDPFTAGELAVLHSEDVSAARAIVVLMASIFTMGVIGYAIICMWVA